MASSSTDLMPESSTSLEQDRPQPLRTVRSVLLCGASVRSLAESAILAGLRPLCVDFFEDSDLSQLLSGGRGRFLGQIHSFTDLPRLTHSVRTSVPLLWTGGIENHSDVLRVMARRRPVIGPDPEIIDRLRDPARLLQWLTDAGLASPRLASQSSADPLCEWLQKPMASSGGIGIRQYFAAGGPESGTLPMPSTLEHLQEYIDGIPMSALLCSTQQGVTLIGQSLQLTGWPSLGASGFLFCGNAGPVDPGNLVTHQVQAAADAIVRQTGLRGVFGVDFILRQGVAWFLEVNPRLTASHMLYEPPRNSTGSAWNLVRQHLAAFGWQPAGSISGRTRAVSASLTPVLMQARLILWASEALSIPCDAFHSHPSPSETYRLADVPPSATTIPAGSPLCSVHVNASSAAQLVESIQQLQPSPFLSERFSWLDISRQLSLLFNRFEKNLVPPPDHLLPEKF